MGKLVLDVGCGSRPNKHANVFVDRYPWNDKQRSGRKIKKFPKNFVVADVENLPFRDKVFGYCYCVHLIEHTSQAHRALNEINRVAKAGYVSAPHMYFEFSFGKRFHKWFVYAKGRRFLMFQKNKTLFEYSPFQRELKPIFLTGMLYKMLKRAKLIEVGYHWKRSISYVVVYNDGKCYTENKEE